MKSLWVVASLFVVTSTPAPAASGQVGFLCSGTAIILSPGVDSPAYRAWHDVTMVLDLDRKLVFHGDGSERYPIHKIKHDVITWKSDEGDLTGFLSRQTLEGGEFHHDQGSVVHRAYSCRPASYLSFRIEP